MEYHFCLTFFFCYFKLFSLEVGNHDSAEGERINSKEMACMKISELTLIIIFG